MTFRTGSGVFFLLQTLTHSSFLPAAPARFFTVFPCSPAAEMNVMAMSKFCRDTFRRFSVTNVASQRMMISFAPHLSTPGGRHARNHYDLDSIPKRIDWREGGAVGPVKDQGSTCCCWAFSTVAAVESLIKIKTGKLLCLSEQQLLDCVSGNYIFRKCNGSVEFAFDWITKNGIVLQSVWPYTGRRDKSKCHRISPPAARINGYKHVPYCNEAALQIAVSKQPVVVGINPKPFCWRRYEGGIIKGGSRRLSKPIQDKDLSHSVTLVGYDTTPDGRKYWIVKNSWGTEWGEKGFAKLERGTGSHEGVLGVNMCPLYPVF